MEEVNIKTKEARSVCQDYGTKEEIEREEKNESNRIYIGRRERNGY